MKTLVKVTETVSVSSATLELLIKLLESKNGKFSDYGGLSRALNSSFNVSVTEEEVVEHHRLGIEIEDLKLTMKNCNVL